MVDLGAWGDILTAAYDVSLGATVIVGGPDQPLDQATPYRAALRWMNGSIQNLNQVYASLLTDGLYLDVATAVSPDGRYIVGGGYNASLRRYEAYLLDTGCSSGVYGDIDGNGCVDDTDLLEVIYALGTCVVGCADLNSDGVVDDADLLAVIYALGTGCE